MAPLIKTRRRAEEEIEELRGWFSDILSDPSYMMRYENIDYPEYTFEEVNYDPYENLIDDETRFFSITPDFQRISRLVTASTHGFDRGWEAPKEQKERWTLIQQVIPLFVSITTFVILLPQIIQLVLFILNTTIQWVFDLKSTIQQQHIRPGFNFKRTKDNSENTNDDNDTLHPEPEPEQADDSDFFDSDIEDTDKIESKIIKKENNLILEKKRQKLNQGVELSDKANIDNIHITPPIQSLPDNKTTLTEPVHTNQNDVNQFLDEYVAKQQKDPLSLLSSLIGDDETSLQKRYYNEATGNVAPISLEDNTNETHASIPDDAILPTNYLNQRQYNEKKLKLDELRQNPYLGITEDDENQHNNDHTITSVLSKPEFNDGYKYK